MLTNEIQYWVNSKKKTMWLSIISCVTIYTLLSALVWIIREFYQPFHIFKLIPTGGIKILMISLIILICSIITTLLSRIGISTNTQYNKRAYFMTAFVFVASFLINKSRISAVYLMELLSFTLIYSTTIIFFSKRSKNHIFIIAFSMITLFHFISMVLSIGDTNEGIMSALKTGILRYLLGILIAMILHEVFISVHLSKQTTKSS